MKTAGIVIDKWKLPIFKKRLDDAGYAFETNKGLTDDTLILLVKTKSIAKLQPIVKKMNEEAAKYKNETRN